MVENFDDLEINKVDHIKNVFSYGKSVYYDYVANLFSSGKILYIIIILLSLFFVGFQLFKHRTSLGENAEVYMNDSIELFTNLTNRFWLKNNMQGNSIKVEYYDTLDSLHI